MLPGVNTPRETVLKLNSIPSHPLPATVQRVLLPLAVVFVVLATAGWMARGEAPDPDPYEIELQAWRHGHIAGDDLPDPQAPPAEILAFFAGLTQPQQRRLANRYPLVVGNLPGAPVRLRYHANRRALRQAWRVEHRRRHDKRLSVAGQNEAGRRRNRFASLLAHDRQILAFDPTGRGRVAEVFGDLATARRISVVVPGVDTDLLDFERTQRKYTAPAGMAEALYREQRATEPTVPTAVIAWADYEAPPGIVMSAATGALATDGAQRLLRSVGGLPRTASVGLVCHSYGSVVCGIAAENLPSRVTDIAVAGSPGMRASDVAGLHTQARVWAMRADGDWIQDVPHLELGPLGHGTDPATPDFGARLLSTGDAKGHSGYFVPGAESLTNLARIGTGAVDRVRCVAGTRGCAPLDPCLP